MIVRLAAAFVVAAFMFASNAAHAAMFGKDETIHFIQDVSITSQDNKPLFLGYKTTTNWILAGVSISDDGYVFGLREDHSKYIETTPDEIAKFQKSGLLPDPLPPYKIPLIEYILGYSLWIVIPIVALVYLIGWMRKRKTPAPAI
ncbi:hypothetical protein BH10PSE9_BH10PSE9_08980 [soil metagenome]